MSKSYFPACSFLVGCSMWPCTVHAAVFLLLYSRGSFDENPFAKFLRKELVIIRQILCLLSVAGSRVANPSGMAGSSCGRPPDEQQQLQLLCKATGQCQRPHYCSQPVLQGLA
eukprot:1160014-Pelagomonas_calceolata.AAC.5